VRPQIVSYVEAQMDIVMILKCIAFVLAAAVLGGCCVSGTGCYAPLPGAPIAWDGLGVAPTENGGDEDKPRRRSRRAHEIAVGPLRQAGTQSDSQSQFKDRWMLEQDVEREADAKLTKQLRICTHC
jgi:hypothetical protein